MPLRLSLALAHYDRHVPLFEGIIAAENIELQVVEVGNATDRHRRMLQNHEFDAAEVSLSSYIMARSRGVPVIAIPVFPRRLFSQSSIYVNAGADIQSPEDLIGKCVGLNSYQTTLSVLAKGDLQHEYGVSLTEVTWVTSKEELFPFTAPKGVVIQQISPGKEAGQLLETGEISALITPRPPPPLLRGSRAVRRLFPEPQDEEISYFRKFGFYPIMHTIALREQVLLDNPPVAARLVQVFERAKEACYRRYNDPNWSHLAWGRLHMEEQRQIMGPDPWPNGISRNRLNLERFMAYSREQGLIDSTMSAESLFAKIDADTI